MEYYIGIDIGTSSTKAVIIDENRKLHGECEQQYRFSQPYPGWKEIDPKIWVEATETCILELLSRVDNQLVKAIGVTGQMHTTVFIDEYGKSIRPAIMWNDTRSKDLVELVKSKLGVDDTKYISKIISTGSPAMNLFWVKENEVENFNKIRKFLIGPDYITYYLTGLFNTDYCEASTSSLYDLENKTWSKTMQNIIGIDDDVYPSVKGSSETAGYIKDEIAQKLGLNKDVKIIVGTGDNPAAAVATGCLEYMYPVLSLGTSGVLVVTKNNLDLKSKGKNILFSIDGEKIHILKQGVVQSVGSTLNWLIRDIFETNDFDKYTTIANDEDLGKNELLFYPHLAGDKTLYKDPSIRGAFIGIGTETTREDMAIAVMEGICFAVKELVDAMNLSADDINNMKVIGGGTKSKIFIKILSDVLNTRIERLNSVESGASYGVAILAQLESTNYKDSKKNNVEILDTFIPRASSVKLYEEKYKKYLKIYKSVKEILK